MRAWRGAMIVVAVAAYFVVSLSWLARERLRDRSTFAPASIHNESGEGCALAYRYLQATRSDGSAVRVLAQPVGWEPLPPDAVVFRLRPALPRLRAEDVQDKGPDEKSGKKRPLKSQAAVLPLLTRDEEQWIHGGGRLVLGLDQAQRGVSVGPLPASTPIAKTFPIWPGVTRLAPPTRRAFEGTPSVDGQAIFMSGARAVVWRRPLGRGEIVFLSTPEILENRALDQAHHLALLAALAGSGRAVYFDEHAHGLQSNDGLVGLLLRWGLGPALLLAGMAFALLYWRRRTPIGPCEEESPVRRSEAVDLVDSMAQLYDRVLSRSAALARYARTFERTTALRTGLTGRALAARVRAHMGEPPPTAPSGKDIPAVEFGHGLMRVNAAFRRLEEHAHARRSR
jgi:hypothetical protein